jgi:hypothetical protein
MTVGGMAFPSEPLWLTVFDKNPSRLGKNLTVSSADQKMVAANAREVTRMVFKPVLISGESALLVGLFFAKGNHEG